MQTFIFLITFLLAVILNFYQFDRNPPGLYADEVSIGVNAYSILKTGKDEYGIIHPLYFKSYGEYKTPIYIYFTALTMAFFGKNEFAVRLPSSVLGTLTVLFVFLLVKELISHEKTVSPYLITRLPLLTSFLLAVSPWYLQLTGPAFEVTAALFFFTSGSYFLITAVRKKNLILLCLSLIFFLLTVYTYHSYKSLTPIVFIILFVKLIREKRKSRFTYASLLFLPVFFLGVLFSFANYTRFLQTSAFPSASISNVMIFLKNYMSYFSLNFLFNTGDGISRHQFIDFGILARWTSLLLIPGFYFIVKLKKSFLKYAVLATLILSPVPAALTTPSPHTLRSYTMVIPLILVISCGIILIMEVLKKNNRFLIPVITAIFIYEFAVYLHFGFFHYPNTTLIDWGGNYKEVVRKATALSTKYRFIAVSDKLPEITEYFRFYNESLKPITVNPAWNKKQAGITDPVLLITADLTGCYPPSPHLVDTVYLPNANNNIFAQFWEI